MAFTWTQSITQYTNVERADIQEIRDKTDWLDNNVAYCGSNYTTYYATHYTTYRSAHYITYNASNYSAYCTSHYTKSPSCFTKNCVVIMYDGSKKLIQDIKIGEFVLGAYGDKNEVLYLDRPLRGDRIIWDIEGLYTTDEHPIMNGKRNGFCITSFSSWYNDKQQFHTVINSCNEYEQVFLESIDEATTNVEQLHLGSRVATINGHKLITRINATYRNDELLFNLVLGGSHTYCVNDIFVSGFCNDKDFDYINGYKRINIELNKNYVGV